jgi:adenylate kinase family enzyme
MSHWDYSIFEEQLGNTVEYGAVVGNWYSGKSTVAKAMAEHFSYEIVDMKAISEKLKASMGTEDEPFEGEVPAAGVEEAVVKFIRERTHVGKRVRFIFDGFAQKGATAGNDFVDFTSQFGVPKFLINLVASEETIKARYCKAKELDDVPEDAVEEFKAAEEADIALRENLAAAVAPYDDRVTSLTLHTDSSLESTVKELVSSFAPRVLLVNHEKRLGIDTTCANLAIKYNMIYISAYQIIKQHIEGKTEWGTRLLASKRTKEISLTTQVRDEFNELEYSPVHFNQNDVIQLIRDTIM